MKFLLFFSRCLFFIQILLSLNLTYSFSANPEDSIKPIKRIDKEFLVVAHIIHAADNSMNIDTNSIGSYVSAVNAYFAPIGATFTLCEIRNIYNFQYDTIRSTTRKRLLSEYWVANRINIFYVLDILDGPAAECGNADLGGITYKDPNQVGIVLKKDPLCQSPLVYAHELGHYFSLLHTFELKNGNELVNGINCATTGDLVCDTPADPEQNGDNVDGDCNYTSLAKDANGEYYQPDVSNIMSYYPSPCKCSFTKEQFNKMANYYLSNPFEW